MKKTQISAILPVFLGISAFFGLNSTISGQFTANSGSILVPWEAGLVPVAGTDFAMETVILSQDPPQETPPGQEPGQDTPTEPPTSGNPGHQQPTEYCTPHNRPDGKVPCMCMMNSPNGCKEGHRDTEMANCNSNCWKLMCHCCAS